MRPTLPLMALIPGLALSPALLAGAFEATEQEVTAFMAADRNRDLVLDRAEFRTFILLMAETGQSTSKTIRTFGAYGYAFKIADRDRDGVITPQELRTADDEYRAAN